MKVTKRALFLQIQVNGEMKSKTLLELVVEEGVEADKGKNFDCCMANLSKIINKSCSIVGNMMALELMSMAYKMTRTDLKTRK